MDSLQYLRLMCAKYSTATVIALASTITVLVSRCFCNNARSEDLSKVSLWISKESIMQYTLIYILVILHFTSSAKRFANHCKNKSSLGLVLCYALSACLIYLSFVYHLYGNTTTLIRFALPTFFYLFEWERAANVVDEVIGSSSDEKQVSPGNISVAMSKSFSCILPRYVIQLLVLAFGITSGIHELQQLSTVISLALATELVASCILLPALVANFFEVTTGIMPSESININDIEIIKDNQHQIILKDHINMTMIIGLLSVHFVNFVAKVFVNGTLLSEFLFDVGYENSRFNHTVDELYFYGFIAHIAVKHAYSELSECLEDITKEKATTKSESAVVETIESLPRAECTPKVESKKPIIDKDILPSLSNAELVSMLDRKEIPLHSLESLLKDLNRAVNVRRLFIAKRLRDHGCCLDNIPWSEMDYKKVHGVCCENVVGYTAIPIGVFGPLNLDNKQYYVPLATTEGCLVASTNRGCAALRDSGVSSFVVGDGMTRGPIVRLPSAKLASLVKHWIEIKENQERLEQAFNATSRFLQLKSIKCAIAGRLLFIRFRAITGDAMGMNMLSKGTEHAIRILKSEFPEMEIVSISGNYCTDKKPSAINWIDGRGKNVVCEATVSENIIKKVLKTTVEALVDVNINKNFIGSAMAGSIGGQNAHASNIVTGIFIATGQDPAQNVESSNCITILEATGPEKRDLYISCSMPSLEVGTVGGGTSLPSQAACLEMLGVCGSGGVVGENANRLARIVCASVLAGELSLLSALAAGHLVKSHLKHNRSAVLPAPFNKCPVL